MSLFAATRDMHHACEAHPIGQAMVNGAVTPQEWADWLWAMRCLHSVVDAALPEHMARDAVLCADLSVLPPARASRAAMAFAASLIGHDTTGAAYVLHGAHCSGGRVLAPKMAKRGLPTAHTSYRYPESVRAWLAEARSKAECAGQARATFACLLKVMDEISGGLPEQTGD
jgi:hypothetical protein